jgi:hypothetical protein
MIEEGARPANGRVTGIALQVRIDMLRAFTLRLDVVVAG